MGSSSSLSAGFFAIFFSSIGYNLSTLAVCGRGIYVVFFLSPTTAVIPPTDSLCLTAFAIGSSSSAFSTSFFTFFSSGFAPLGLTLGIKAFFSSSFKDAYFAAAALASLASFSCWILALLSASSYFFFSISAFFFSASSALLLSCSSFLWSDSSLRFFSSSFFFSWSSNFFFSSSSFFLSASSFFLRSPSSFFALASSAIYFFFRAISAAAPLEPPLFSSLLLFEDSLLSDRLAGGFWPTAVGGL